MSQSKTVGDLLILVEPPKKKKQKSESSSKRVSFANTDVIIEPGVHAPLDALLDPPKPAIYTEEKVDKSNGTHEPATVTAENVDEDSDMFKSLSEKESIYKNADKESSTTEAEVTDMFKGLTKKKKKSKKVGDEISAQPTSAEDPLPSSTTANKGEEVMNMFEGLAKKKKKPKKAGDEIPAQPSSAEDPPPSSTTEKEGKITNMLAGLAKKKKKSKKAGDEISAQPASAEDPLPSSTTEDKEDEDLSKDLTKKKKKSPIVGDDRSAEPARPVSADSPTADAPEPKMITGAQVEEITDMFKGVAKKKKSKKTDKKSKSAEPAEAEAEAEPDDGGEEEGGDPDEGTGIWNHNARKDLNYGQLLDRFFQTLQEKNPDMMSGKTKSYKIPPPQCVREGNKKTIFANIADICNRMDRSDDHVTSYLFAELGTNGSVDGSRRLVIKGRFQQKQIENVLRRYIGRFQLPFSVFPVPSPIQSNKFFFSLSPPKWFKLLKIIQLTLLCTYSGIRHLQNLPLPKHRIQQGRSPAILCHMQFMQ